MAELTKRINAEHIRKGMRTTFGGSIWDIANVTGDEHSVLIVLTSKNPKIKAITVIMDEKTSVAVSRY